MAKITIAPAKLDFSVRKGSTLRRTLTWYSDPVWLDARETQLDVANSTPLDLSGYTARMQVRAKTGNQVVFDLTTENGGLTLGGAAGTITFFISHVDTDNPSSDKNVYDLEIVDLTGDVIPLVAGAFVLVNQVTT